MADAETPALAQRPGGSTPTVLAECASAAKQVVKRVLFPGVDVHARSRYRHLPVRFFDRLDPPGPISIYVRARR